ncbi:MAG TPA: non-canonical purine NTP pyrophosphatase, partial [Nocardioides sp.]|nr:non-canonical purine NTP pyrophosphatase [Nocardioides sp.]
AHFTCAIAFCAPGHEPLVVEGRMDGRVIHETRGSGGFGYDVLFEAVEFPGRTTAELDAVDKDAISHRGRALREIAPQIVRVLPA